MLASRAITLSPSFPLPLSLNRRLVLLFSSKVLPMGERNNNDDSAKLSRVEPPPGRGNSAVLGDLVMPDNPLSDTSHENEEYMMVGTNLVPLPKSIKNNSFPLSTRCKSSAAKSPESMSKFDHLPSPTTSTVSEHRKFKRTRVDLGLAQANGNNCSESNFSSSFEENSSISLAKTLSTTNFTSHHDESPQPCNFFWRKEAASANRSYNSHSKINYASAGHKMDSSYSVPKFKPYDICFRGKRNSALIGATLLQKNMESCIEMQEGGTKEGILRPGMVLLKHYLTHDEQVEIVKNCRELGLGPGGFFQPGYADGAKLRLKMMCLGMDWDPQTRKYGYKRAIDDGKPPSIPHYFSKLVIRAIQEAHRLINKEYGTSYVEDILPSMNPDICIVNFYTNSGRLGLHQDRDESRESLQTGLPIVSFSIGDSAKFLYGDQRDVEKAENVLLESGDVLIFGGKSRHVFHGVSSIIPDSAPKELLQETWLCPGRLNLTFRQY